MGPCPQGATVERRESLLAAPDIDDASDEWRDAGGGDGSEQLGMLP